VHKALGLLFALSLALPIGVLAATPAGAAGAGCTKISGSVTFSPGLPISSSKATVKPTITESVVSSGCTGGGVKSGTTSVKAKSTAGLNCSNIASALGKTTGTVTEVWNTKATSTLLATLSPVKGQTTQLKLTTKVTAGLFKGTTTTAILALNGVAPTGACTKVPLTKLIFGSVGKVSTK
jgi:hypothetical protein